MKSKLILFALCFSFALQAQIYNEHHVYHLFDQARAEKINYANGDEFIMTGFYKANMINGMPTNTDRIQLIQLDSIKKVNWAKTLVLNSEIQVNNYNVSMKALDVEQISSGGYIVAGEIRFPDPNGQPSTVSSFLLKVSASGNPIWMKKYFDHGWLKGVTETWDGGYIAVGYERESTGLKKCRILRVNGFGSVVYLKKVETTTPNTESELVDVIEYGAKKYAMVGSCNQVRTGCGLERSDVLLSLVDENGVPFFSHYAFGRNTAVDPMNGDSLFVGEMGATIAIDVQGMLLIGGQTIYTPVNCGPHYSDLLMFQTTPTGITTFKLEYNIAQHDYMNGFIIDNLNNEYVMTGNAYPEGYLLRTDILGNVNGLEMSTNGNPLEMRSVIQNQTTNNYISLGGGYGFTNILDDDYLIEYNPSKDTDCHDYVSLTAPVGINLPVTVPDEVDLQLDESPIPVTAVDLMVIDSVLCESTCPPPIANRDTVYICENSSATFDVSLNDSYTGISLFTLGTSPSHGTATVATTTGMGSYTPNTGHIGVDSAYYILVDDCGAQTTIIIFITEPLPEASFTISNTGPGTYLFTNNSTDHIGSTWDFGDGTGSTTESPTHVYTGTGYYVVCLEVINACGSDMMCDTISIPVCPPPIAMDDIVTLCTPFTPITYPLAINDGYTGATNFSIITPPSNGFIIGLDAATGLIDYQSGPPTYTGDSIQYELCDACGCDSAWFLIKCPVIIGPIIVTPIIVYLQGAYQGPQDIPMDGNLLEMDLLPADQPFSGAPWFYEGDESVSPNILAGTDSAEIIDWIFIQLRNGEDAEELIEQKAGLLRRDGKVVDVNGNDFSWNVEEGEQSFHLLMDHRNHLAIISESPLSRNGSDTLHFAFADGSVPAYGENAMFDQFGAFLMIAGDATSDEVINAVDKSIWQSDNGSTPDYLNHSDFNLDGTSNAVDYNQIFRPNNSLQSQIWFTWYQ